MHEYDFYQPHTGTCSSVRPPRTLKHEVRINAQVPFNGGIEKAMDDENF